MEKFGGKYGYYLGFLLDKINSFIKDSKNYKEPLHIISLLKENRGYINSEVIGLIVEILENCDDQESVSSALFLVGQLVVWGDIEAILMITYSNVIENLANKYLPRREK